METIISSLSQLVGVALARTIVAIGILLLGWILAAIVAGVIGGILGRIGLDSRVAGAMKAPEDKAYPVTSWLRTIVFWFLMLFAIVAALEALGLTAVATAINGMLAQVVAFLPSLVAAGILALAAHVLGTIVRRVISGVMQRTNVDERVGKSSGTAVSIGAPLGDAGYYLVWLLFLPVILGALGLESLLVPVQGMINQILAFLPLLAAAAIVVVVGWFVARIVQRIIEGFLASVGVDAFAERVGIARYMGGLTVSHLIGLFAFIVILVPVITAALAALNLTALTVPLTAMITQVIVAIPKFVLAVALLVVTYVVARWLISILVEILTGLGLNSLPRVFGLGEKETIGNRSLAQWAGDVILLIVMLLAAVQAAQILDWTAVTAAVGAFGTQAVLIVFGLVIIAVGIWLANLAAQFIAGTTMPNKNVLVLVARAAIILFVGAMGLTAMGFADSIVFIAFALTFGAIAIAVAVAFGLGGRNAAAELVDEWKASLEFKPQSALPRGSASDRPSPAFGGRSERSDQ